jgi:hypothetical protein
MYGSELCAFSFWWIVPIVMMILCFFIMRGRRGRMMSGFGCCGRDWQHAKDKDEGNGFGRESRNFDRDWCGYGGELHTLFRAPV